MAEANAAFTAAVKADDVEAAIDADDAFHDVAVRVAGNRPAAATIERFTPLIRRLERARFREVPGRDSVRLHRELLRAFREGDVDAAVATTTTIWSSLESQLDAARTAPHPQGATR
jgi:DNA-binding GntR family transcriptional regulator